MSYEYLRAFVIGSSFFVFFPYLFVVSQFDPKKFNFNYKMYSFIAPIGLGLANVISLFIANSFKLTREMRYLVISLLAPTFVIALVYFLKIYNYTSSEWLYHIFKVYLMYLFMFNCIVYLLDKYV